MSQRIVIAIEVPDGVQVQVTRTPWEAARDIFAEEPPPPDEPAFRGSAPGNPGTCPIHLKPWKTVEAGISKKTGRPYSAFQACPEQGCNERPR